MDFTALVFGFHTHFATAHYGAVSCLTNALDNMRVAETMTIGFVYDRHWQVTQSTRQNQALAFAIEFLVRNVFHGTGVTTAKIGRGIRTFPTAKHVNSTTLIWWTHHIDKHSVFEARSNKGYQTKDVVGDQWKKMNYLQLLMAPGAGIEMSSL